MTRDELAAQHREHAAALDELGLKMHGDVHRSQAAILEATRVWRCAFCGSELEEGIGCCGESFAECAEPVHESPAP